MNQHPSSPATASVWPARLTVLLGLLALIAETGSMLAGFAAQRAREDLRAGRPAAAIASAETALRLDPWQPRAAYTRLVALKRLGRWQTLASDAQRTRGWHLDTRSVDLLAGEAAFQTGDHEAAAEALWRAFRRSPRPPHDGPILWLMALRSGQAVWPVDDPRNVAAAWQTGRVAQEDPGLDAARRRDIVNEAATALREARAPEAAAGLLAALAVAPPNDPSGAPE